MAFPSGSDPIIQPAQGVDTTSHGNLPQGSTATDFAPIMPNPTQETIIVPSESAPATPPPEIPVPTVIPAATETPLAPVPEHLSSSSGSTQFMPQGVSTGSSTQSPPVREPGPWKRRIIMIVVFLALLLMAAFGAKFALGMINNAKGITLDYWGLWENDTTLQSIFADYHQKNPRITIRYTQQSPKQYRERLQAAIERGSGPDIFRFHNTWIPMLKADMSTVPTSVMSVSEFTSTFYPIAKNDLVGGSTIFGIPLEIDGLGLYYNEDLFAAAGVLPPATWEDVVNIAPKLTVKTDAAITTSAIALGTTGNVEHFSDIIALMMVQNGARLTDLTSKEAQEALIFYKKFSTSTDPVYSWNNTLDNSVFAFANGKVAMILAPSWRAFDIRAINPSIRFKIVPVPQLPGNNVTWASYWVEGVSSKSQNQLEAWKFLKYLSSSEVMTKMYTEQSKIRLFGEPYSRVDLANTLTADPYVGAFIRQVQNAYSFPLASRTFDNGLNDKLIKYIEDAINGMDQNGSPDDLLRTANSGFQQVFNTYGLAVSTAPASSTSK